MPQGEHSALQGDLAATINGLRTRKIARAFPELRCTFGGRSIIPDISVFVADRIPLSKKHAIDGSRFKLPSIVRISLEKYVLGIATPSRVSNQVIETPVSSHF